MEQSNGGDAMEEQRLSFALMLSYLNRVVAEVEDPR
jgi:hypothetical protein